MQPRPRLTTRATSLESRESAIRPSGASPRATQYSGTTTSLANLKRSAGSPGTRRRRSTTAAKSPASSIAAVRPTVTAQADFISVIWTNSNSPPTQIGTLPGDSLSEPTSIDNRGDVLGVSFPSSDVYLWQNGSFTDLTKLLALAYPQLRLVSVGGINDRGEIAGQACELVSSACPSSNPTLVTVLAVPS